MIFSKNEENTKEMKWMKENFIKEIQLMTICVRNKTAYIATLWQNQFSIKESKLKTFLKET